ncbi:hypothetical protein ACEPPN_017116 [Leptodophora sp. 'Broadleaf-Isolate-01']
MATLTLAAVEEVIADSRRESSVGNFPEALLTLRALDGASSSAYLVRKEVCRLRIILGDHKSITLTPSATLPIDQQESETYNDLLCIQLHLSRISGGGDIAQSLQSAKSLFQRYEKDVTSEELESTVLLILYYSLEVHYFWKLYGDGIPDPKIAYDGTFLQQLALHLTREGFYFETLELLEHFVKDSEPQIEALASSLLAEDNLAGTACLIRLAVIRGRNGDTDGVEELLNLLDQLLSDDHKIARIQCELISKRFLETSLNQSERTEQLLQLSETLSDLGDYNTALQALEYAAEVESTLLASGQTREHAVRIHASLQQVCERSGDHLSQTLFQFRNCDVINSVTGDLSVALNEREKLLSAPLCSKLPYFQRFHRRQWAEYFMLHQRENALRHANLYLEYCRNYRGAEEQSVAENMRTQTELQPARMSEDAREASLEEIRMRLQQGIEADKRNEWYISQVEKQLLLVEVLEGLGRIQEEEPEEIAQTAIKILDDAIFTCEKIKWESENIYLKFEIMFLRGAASDLSQSSITMDEGSQALSVRTNTNAYSLPSPPVSFKKTQCFQELMLAIRNESLPAFQRLFDYVWLYMDRPDIHEDSLRRAEFLNFKGMLYYLLMKYESPTIRQFWNIAGFNSFVKGSKMALECFEEAFNITDKVGKDITELNKSADTMTKLVSGQAYLTNAIELLIFEIALELSFGLDDKSRTWDWIQRSKARGLSNLLRSSLEPEDLQKGPDYLSLSKSLTFEDLQFIQTASARKLVFVDWISFGACDPKLLCFSFSMGRDETGPIGAREMIEIDIPMQDLKEAARRITDARMDSPDASDYLHPFMPLIEPLANSSEPGDILILSPTAPLHAVPLHAIILGSNQLLIERNPVVYVPSHSALLSCLQRLSAPEPGAERPDNWIASVFGAYDDNGRDPHTVEERREIYHSLENLAIDLGTTPVLGTNLTKTSFNQLSQQVNLLHFHGHGISDPDIPERNSLALGTPNETINVSDIAALNLHGSHVTLIACSGAVQDFSLSGDEPLGLFSSFLLGGASSAIGALWPIQSSTGRLFTRVFYEYFLRHLDRTELGPIVNLAMAVQHTVLEIKRRQGFETPYHWAPFVLYGAWFSGRKTGTW